MSRETVEPFLDIEEAVLWWGENKCINNAFSRRQKKFKKQHFEKKQNVLDVQIDWSHLLSSNRTVWREISDADFSHQAQSREDGSGDAKGESATKRAASAPYALPPAVERPDANVLFETDFNNTTGILQTCTLNISKTTSSSCETVIENGVTKCMELSASLSVGDFLEVSAGFSREVALTKTEGETIEASLTWSAESTVNVPPKKRATAQMRVIEKQESGDFIVLTTMTGYVIIKYVSFKDNSLVFMHSGKVDSIIKKYVNEKKIQGKKFRGIEYPADAKVEFQTKGKCRFRYGVKQVVTVALDPPE